MRTTSRIIGTIVGVALLTAAVSACDEKETTDALSSTSVTAAETPEPSQEDATPQGDEAAPVEAEASAPEPAESEPAEPSVDADVWTGPGEDPATMEDTRTVVDYETLPGDCLNDVPMPEIPHGDVEVENLPGDECLITIDARGDSLTVVNDVSQQLEDAGFTHSSGAPDDSSENAINVVSYVTNTHEVYVTVSQNGASGVLIRYALTDPSRGNG